MESPQEFLAKELGKAKEAIRVGILDEIDTEAARTALLRLIDRHPDRVERYQAGLEALK